MSNWTQEEVEKAIKSVILKAATDKDFRAKLLDNPSAAIEVVTGKDLPDNYRLKIIESDPNFDTTYVLPPFKTDELSESELEAVAGGRCSKDKGFHSDNPCFGIHFGA